MKKKISFYLSICLIFVLGFSSCSDDETSSLFDSSFVHIEYEGSADITQGEDLLLKANVKDSAWINYEWFLNGKQVSTKSEYLFTPNDAGKYEIKLTVYNKCGEASVTEVFNVGGKYKNGTFILNEGAVWRGDLSGTLVFISPQGEVQDSVFYKENNQWLGNCPQDLFILNDKMYIVCQNGRTEGETSGGYLVVANAETLKVESVYQNELSNEDIIKWPTHVAALSEDDIYLRDDFHGVFRFKPSTKEITFIEGTNKARKNTMAVADGKLFVSKRKTLLVIEPGKTEVSYIIDFDKTISGVLRASDGNLWVSTAEGRGVKTAQADIIKLSSKDYSIIQKNEIEKGELSFPLIWSMAATPHISAKEDTLYMSGLAPKIYRHIFSENKTELMVDVASQVENAGIIYNTSAVDPITGYVYINSIKSYQEVDNNNISVFDFSGKNPVLKANHKGYLRFPAGIFFTENFKK